MGVFGVGTYLFVPWLVAAQGFLLVFVALSLIPDDDLAAYALGAGKSVVSTAAFTALCMANGCFLIYIMTSPTRRLAAHWRHALLISASFSILVVEIVFVSLGRGAILDSNMKYYMGGILCCLFLHTLFFSTVLFPLRRSSGDYQAGGALGIATYSFTIPMTIPPDSGIPLYKEQQSYEIPVQVWYPSAKPTSLSLPPVMLWTSGSPSSQDNEMEALISAILKNIKLPGFLLQHVALATHSPRVFFCDEIAKATGAGAASSTGGRPIAIVLHGLWGWRQLGTSTVFRLVDAGFVVLALDHCPSAYISRPPFEHKTSYTPFDFTPPHDTKPGTLEEKSFYNGGLERRSAEVKCLIDFLHDSNSSPIAARLRSMVDLRKLHLVGHSFGAATASLVCSRDSRIASSAMLDAWMFPLSTKDLQTGSLSASTLFMSSDIWDLGPFQVGWRRIYSLASRARGLPSFLLKVNGADHQNFADIYLLCSSLLLKGMLGPKIDPFALTLSINDTVCRFFERRNAEIDQSAPSARDDVKEPLSPDDCFPLLCSSAAADEIGSLSVVPLAEELEVHGETARLAVFLGASTSPPTLGDALLDSLCVDDVVPRTSVGIDDSATTKDAEQV